MKQITTTAMICLDDDLGLTYYISKIEYLLREDDTFSYIFTPNYSVIDLLTSEWFQGIPGLKLELRKPQYIRENRTPVFISERTPGENRENLQELLEECHIDYLNRLEWLIRTSTRYGGDYLYATRWESDKKTVDFAKIDADESRSAAVIRQLLREICAGNDIHASDFVIDDSNRKAYYTLLTSLYRKEKTYLDKQRSEGIRRSAAHHKYRGRPPVKIDDTRLYEVSEKYISGAISAQEAAANLGISRSAFFRRIKKKRDLR